MVEETHEETPDTQEEKKKKEQEEEEGVGERVVVRGWLLKLLCMVL